MDEILWLHYRMCYESDEPTRENFGNMGGENMHMKILARFSRDENSFECEIFTGLQLTWI